MSLSITHLAQGSPGEILFADLLKAFDCNFQICFASVLVPGWQSGDEMSSCCCCFCFCFFVSLLILHRLAARMFVLFFPCLFLCFTKHNAAGSKTCSQAVFREMFKVTLIMKFQKKTLSFICGITAPVHYHTLPQAPVHYVDVKQIYI